MATPINKILLNQIQKLSNEELANVSASLSAILGQGSGETHASAWLPTVTEDGDISWTLTTSTTAPATANIMGPQGPQGTSGAKGADGISVVLQSVTDVEGGKQVTLAWGETPSTSSFIIPSGAAGAPGTDGKNGTDGKDGVSPTITTTELSPSEQHPQGGFAVTITDQTGSQTINIWNGNNGAGATVRLLEGTGIKIEADGTDYTISVSADYALKSELPVVSDMATQTWVGEQGYLTSVPDTYATKAYANETSANALSAAKSWVNQQNFATSAGLDDDDKQFAMTTAGWKEVAVPSVPDITATNGISANGHNIGLTTDVYSAIQEISAANDLIGANGISVVAGANNQVIIAPSGISPSKQYAMTMTGWEEVQAGTTETVYVPLSGGTMSGQLTISGDSFNNNLHLKRDNNEGFIGLAGNGAITLKNSTNGSTSQIEFLTSDNKTFDITVKDNSTTPQPVGKLYVMSAHSLADATATSANWANDGMLHIILDS